MTEKDWDIAKHLRDRLAGLVQLVDLRVFGSRARGDAEDDSDMDVLVEVESLDKMLKERILEIVWEVGFENFMVISPLIFSRHEIESSPLRSSPIVKAIFQEGLRV